MSARANIPSPGAGSQPSGRRASKLLQQHAGFNPDCLSVEVGAGAVYPQLQYINPGHVDLALFHLPSDIDRLRFPQGPAVPENLKDQGCWNSANTYGPTDSSRIV